MARALLRSPRWFLSAIAFLVSPCAAQVPPEFPRGRAEELLRAATAAPDSNSREAALRELLGALDAPLLESLLAQSNALLRDGEAADRFWRRLCSARADLVPWVYEAWHLEGPGCARDRALELVSFAIAGGSQIQEDLRPLIVHFPPELWAPDEAPSLVDLVRDLAQLGGAKLPLVIDPQAPATGRTTPPVVLLSARRGLRGDQWLRDAVAACSLRVVAYPGALWITAVDTETRPAPVDLAERLLAAATSDDGARRRAAFEALGALGLPGWHDWCEGKALRGGATPELLATLIDAGPRGLESPLKVEALELYLPAHLATPPELRLRFRALWRRCLQAPLGAAVRQRLTAISKETTERAKLAWRLLAWLDPGANIPELRVALRDGSADDAVFAARCLRRAGIAVSGLEVLPALRREPADGRLRELALESLEERGLPAPAAREDFAALRSAVDSAAELAELALELDLRAAELERVSGALMGLLRRAALERSASAIGDRLAASFARVDPERRIHEGPRALVFEALATKRLSEPGLKASAAGFAHRMGWILVGDQLLRSEGVDPVPPPRLRDLDPYEGGGGR